MNTQKIERLIEDLVGVQVDKLHDARLEVVLEDFRHAGAGAITLMLDADDKVSSVQALQTEAQFQLNVAEDGVVVGVRRAPEDVVYALEWLTLPLDMRPDFDLVRVAAESLHGADPFEVLGMSVTSFVQRWVDSPNKALNGLRPGRVASREQVENVLRLSVLAARGAAK